MVKGTKAQMQKLREERERLARQIEALQNQLIGMDRLLAVYEGTEYREPDTRERARNVKDTVLGLVAEAGTVGMTVNQVLEAAQRSKNVNLDRGSVSSLLSRLKRENVLDMKDGSYFVRPPGVSQGGQPMTH